MPYSPTTFLPRDMRDAQAVLTDPARHGARPDIIRTCWAFLKEARGQKVHADRLEPHHLISRPRLVVVSVPPAPPIDGPNPLMTLAQVLTPSAPPAPPGLISRLVARFTGGHAA